MRFVSAVPRRAFLLPDEGGRNRRARPGGGFQKAERLPQDAALHVAPARMSARIAEREVVNRKRGTPQCSTTSRAEPMMTVGMPFASRCLATRLTVW